MKNNCPTLTCELQPALHDAAALAPGQRWGAYWKHPDGWMKLFPPAAYLPRLGQRSRGRKVPRSVHPFYPRWIWLHLDVPSRLKSP